MLDPFLAIDPGTYRAGVALFDGPALINWWLLEAPRGMPVDRRIGTIVDQLEAIVAEHGRDVQEVACERPAGIDAGRPAPELQVLVNRLRSWATHRPHRYIWTTYHPSTVLASVRPRGMKRKGAKEVLSLGVRMLYGERIDVDHQDQNVVDAVAVGHCHLVKEKLGGKE